MPCILFSLVIKSAIDHPLAFVRSKQPWFIQPIHCEYRFYASDNFYLNFLIRSASSAALAFKLEVRYGSSFFNGSSQFILYFSLQLFINLKALVNQTGGLSGKGMWGVSTYSSFMIVTNKIMQLVLFPPLVYFIMLIWVVTVSFSATSVAETNLDQVGVSQPNQLECDGAHMYCYMRSPTSSEESTLARPYVYSLCHSVCWLIFAHVTGWS